MKIQDRKSFITALVSLTLNAFLILVWTTRRPYDFSGYGFALAVLPLSVLLAAYSVYRARKNGWLSLEGNLAITALFVSALLGVVAFASLFTNY